MAVTVATGHGDTLNAIPIEESEALIDEVIDASLNPDRAHHDELGRTNEPLDDGEPPASPREQPAAPLDLTKTGE